MNYQKSETRVSVSLVLSFGLLLIDRLSKWFFLKSPDFYSGNLIELKLFPNRNFYFIPLNRQDNIWLAGLSGAVLLLLLFLFFRTLKKKNFLLILGLSLIIFGGISNLFDRLYFGYVIDWLRIFILPISVFNFADLMIITGILILTLNYFKLKKTETWVSGNFSGNKK